MSPLVRPPAAIDYPSSDGKPLAENDAQLHAILYAVGVLGPHYAAHPDGRGSRPGSGSGVVSSSREP